MSKSNTLENALLDEVLGGTGYTPATDTYIALYTAAPSDSGGGTEVTGGSYARVQKTNNATNWPAASGGAKSNGTAITFATATANWGEVVAFAIHDHVSADQILYWGYLRNATPLDAPGTATDSGDQFTSYAHGLAVNDRVVFVAPDGGTLPTGISAGTVYHVINTATDTFQVSTTQGGSAVTLTTNGEFIARRILPKTVNDGDTASFAIGDLDITED